MRILKEIKTYPMRGDRITTEDIKITDKIVCDKCAATLWEASHPSHKDFFSSTATWGKKQLEDIHLCLGCYTGLEKSFTAKA